MRRREFSQTATGPIDCSLSGPDLRVVQPICSSHPVRKAKEIAVNGNELRAQARRHLGPHFTRKPAWDSDFPIFVRGEGSYLIDTEGDRYLDGLAGLFCVNMGHGRSDIAKAAADQVGTLAYASNWGMAHPPAIEAATLI